MTKRPPRKLDKAPATRKRRDGQQPAKVSRQVPAPKYLLLPMPGRDKGHLMAISNVSRDALRVWWDAQVHAVERFQSEAEQITWAERTQAALEGKPQKHDNRRPLVVDHEVIRLIDQPEDGLTQLLTLRLPRVVIDKLRDAAALLQPHKTMAGLATVAILQLLDQIEGQLLEATAEGIPPRPVGTQLGGRPSRLRKPRAKE